MANRFKSLLSWVALILGGFVLAGTTGLLPMSSGTELFLGGVGSLLATAGVPVVVVTPGLAKVLMVVSGMIGAAVTGYWAHHPAWEGWLGTHWFVELVKVGGVAGIVAGVLGRSAVAGKVPGQVNSPPSKP